MKNLFRRFLSLLLVLVLTGSMLPTVFATGGTDEPTVLTQEDYAPIDDLFAQIDAMEEAPAKKNASQTELADEAAALVMASDNYMEGSLERNGNSFTWWTEEGIRCVYSPRMRQIEKDMIAPEDPIADGIYNEPAATKGGWPSGNQVYLIAPYYGYDDTFTDQYKNEATAIATAIGDSDGYTLYSGTAATIDKVAEAMSNGAVVIFDSHGSTDYENGYDYVSGANYSYLCMKSTTGLTTEDYNDGALYYSDGIWITGASIANHMTKQSPAGLLWMAICLGMATDTFAAPMREMGVEVVYGYSQSVTFAGDYLYEETFWDCMCAGDNVATAIATMKSAWGDWDWSTKIATENGYTDGYSTISDARADYAAFPIVVSDEDTHPGQRNGTSNYGADSLQTVKSTYTLFSQYNVTAQSSNTAYGTVSANGSTITATPAEGYYAESATVISGTATVNQNGNTFSVIAQSDCTVQINFAAKTPVTVSFSGATVASQSGYSGDAMTLPTAEAPEGYKFLGWMTSPLTEDTTSKPAYMTGSFAPTGDITLYALYSYVDENSGTGTGDYIKVTETPADWTGEYLIVYEDGSYVMDGSLTSFDGQGNYQPVSITDSTIPAADGDPYKFTVAAVDNGYSIQGTSGYYFGHGSNANGLTTSDSALTNTIGMDASGNANIVCAGGAYLRFNASDQRFRFYKSSTYTKQKAIALYLKDGSAGTTYYTGITVQCEHANTQDVAAVAATCTTSGYSAGVQCTDCSSYISGHEFVAALGHSYSGVMTSPTETEQGYTTYTCANCGDSYVSDYTPALGVSYTVSFSVPADVAAVGSLTGNSSGITLPTAGAPEGYTFEGWSAAAVQETTEVPTILTGTYVPTANTTLYAVYSREETVVGGSTEYVLTDIADITASDVFVITMTYTTDGTIYALANDAVSKAPAAPTVAAADGKLTALPADNLLWNLGGSTGAYHFYPDGTTARWLGISNTNNGISVGTNSANTFSVSNGYLYYGSYGRYVGVYRTNPDWRSYTNTTGNTANQTLGFYVKTGGSITTTYYTTVFETVAAAVYEAGAQVSLHSTAAEAIAACGEGRYVQLLENAEISLTLTQDLYIDLNGYVLSGILNTGDYTVYGMDSTTNEYGASTGYIACQLDSVQTHVLTETAMTGDIYRYMAIQTENGWTFNRYYLGITHISLNTAKVGLGYKAALYGNELVLANVDSFSYTLSLASGGTVTRTMNGITESGIVTLLVKNYDITNYGETNLSAYVTVSLGGQQITSATQTTSMRQVVELINDSYTTYSDEKLAAIKELILANEVMQSWSVANLLAEPADPMVEIVNAAYALAAGESMTTTSTLTGVITKIDTAYSSSYQNISVTIAVAGAEDKPILCYRMTGDGADQITVGDTVTVTGTLKNYNGIIEFDAGCTLDSWTHTGEDVEKLTDPIEIVNAAYALEVGASLPYEVTLTGTITSVDTAYDANYGNVTVTITVAGVEDKPIQCFRLKGTGADTIAVGDTITVTGTLMNYNGTIEFGSGCLLIG